MKIRKMMAISILLLAILTIGAVSATDDSGDMTLPDQEPISLDETITANEYTEIDITDTGQDTTNLSASNALDTDIDDEIETSKKSSNKILKADEKLTFNDLASLISEGSGGGHAYLEGNYTYDNNIDNYRNGVQINANITIHGNGYTIDGINLTRHLNIAGGNVVLENIIFANGNVSGNGGSINGNCSLINCTFINNYASSYGGAIYGTFKNIENSKFINNSANYGGAIYGYGSNIINCAFNDNSAYYASAISGTFDNIKKSNFTNNKAQYYAGAFYGKGSISDCNFINNFAKNYGGAIYASTFGDIDVMNSKFINNTANGSGGAIYHAAAISCIFTNNSALRDGGAIAEGSASKSNFTGNRAGDNGGAVYSSTVSKCIFEYNEAKNGGAMNRGKAGNCTFNYNNASVRGGAIYEGEISNDIHFKNNMAPNGNDTYNTQTFEKPSGKTFTDLNTLINGNSNSTITLSSNYSYYFGSDLEFVKGIPISRAVTINGNGFTINGSDQARIFKVNNKNLALNNIVFANGYGNNGGAIYGNCSISNSAFYNNVVKSDSDGGAVYGDCTIVNCNFTGNKAHNGGAVAGNCIIRNSRFNDNYGSYEGGAVFGNMTIENSAFTANKGYNGGALEINGTVLNCNFSNNSATYGGAIHSRGDTVIRDSIFTGNLASSWGGVVYRDNNANINAINSRFVNNKAYNGGALYRCSATDCNFTNNTANYGGAMYEGFASNCKFEYNNASTGGAIYNTLVTNSLFEYNNASSNGGAMSQGKAINCTFNNNHAENLGGAVYNAKVSTSSQFNNNTATNGNGTDQVTWFERGNEGTFTELAELIKASSETLYLTNNYTFDSDFDKTLVNGTVIDHAITIYGNGFTIDGAKLAKIFNVNASGVIFRDITFINANTTRLNGGAIYGNCTVINCSFANNTAYYGGAIYGNCTVSNSTFKDNYATYGGAIYGNSTVTNSNFTNNNASYYGGGGAMYNGTATNCLFENNYGSSGGAIYAGSAKNSRFINNKASFGGAIYEGNATNCEFTDNNATSYGGAIYGERNQCASNCNFTNNYAYYGGAIYRGSALDSNFNKNTGLGGAGIYDGSARNCNFTNNNARDYGGAIYSSDPNSATNCNFINNSASMGGAVYHIDVKDCNFTSNKANESGGAMSGGYASSSIFKENHADENGGAVLNVKSSNCIFDSNTAKNGGAMNKGETANCTFTNNNATDYGGAICNGNVSTDTIFSNNRAGIEGPDTYNVTFFSNGNKKTLRDLNTLINSNSNATIYLDSNYTYYLGTDVDLRNGIIINRSVTIIGNGFTIDGGDNARIFNVTSGNVIFKNINFVNGKAIGNGGAINGRSTAINCSFTNNNATGYGGAIYNGSATNCTFKDNYANFAGAIYGNDTNATNCLFENNNAATCGAIAYMNAINSIFNNNSANNGGGAMVGGSALNSTFNNNSANNGGACYDVHAINCKFTNNHAIGGGAMRYNIAENCIFINNSVSNMGGAFYQGDGAINCTFINNSAYYGGALTDTDANNCTFINNYANYSGGAIESGNAANSKFINNSARFGGAIDGTYESAINCSFTGNSANNSGGALYGLKAINCNFTSNNASWGGAIFYSNDIENCSFTDNHARNFGGAIAHGTAINSNFTSNIAGSYGGAIYNGSADSCNFKNNNASSGGAIYGGSADNCNFTSNHAVNGGAMNSLGDYTETANNCKFTNNSADNIGGATNQITVTNSEFNKNYANVSGGAMFGGFANNCSFTNNHANQNGGAVYDVKVANSLFEDNSARNGGAMNHGLSANCSFNNNNATDYGGAICNGNVSTDTKFSNNRAGIEGPNTYNVSFYNRPSGKTFADLNDLIYSTNNETIYLDGNYTFDMARDFEFMNGVYLNRSMLINGNGFTLDGSNLARIFNCTSYYGEEVYIYNVTFTNGYSTGFGGAVYNAERIINCAFINNNADIGGAMAYGAVYDSTFINNTANEGGAAYSIYAKNTTFIDNSASDYGGAISTGSADNCTFINNSAWEGGAGYNSEAGDSIFIGNIAELDGGALYSEDGEYVFSCTFINNTADYGGASYGNDIRYSNFTGNTANKGGAMYEGTAYSCNFINNTATDYGGAIYDGDARYSNFTGNTANEGGAICEGEALYCNFISNNATEGGAICDGEAQYCNFTNNNATNGGAMSYGEAQNCNFTGNTAVNGGATYIVYETDCNFTGNTARDYGGAMFGGNYSENVYFENNHAGIEGDNYYAFTPISPVVISHNFTSIYRSGEKLYVNVTYNDTARIGENVTIVVYYKNTYYPIILGVFNCTSGDGWIVDLPVGNYTASIIVNLGGRFGQGNTTVNLTILPAISQISSSPVTAVYNEDKYIVVSLKDAANNPIANATIEIDLDGNKTIKTNDSGQASISTKGVAPGSYNVSFRYDGGGNYNASENKTTLTINKASTTLTASNITVKYNEGKYLVASIKDQNSNPIEGLSIAFNVNSKTSNITTDSNGQARLLIDFNEGTYPANIKFAGNEYYGASSCSATVIVIPSGDDNGTDLIDTVITISATDIKVGQNATINLTLTTTDNIPINGTINLKVDSTEYTVKMNNGKGTQTITNLAKGIHTVTANYKGDNTYNKSSASTDFTVNDDSDPLKNTVITISTTDIKVGQNATINLTLTTTDNIPINGTINLKVDSTEYTVKMNNGKGTQTVTNLAKGVHTVTANYKGDSAYNKSSASTDFTVNDDSDPLKNTVITISVADIKVGQSEVINLTLKTKDNVPINGTIDLKVDTASYTVKITDGKGSQTVANLPKGSHTITANFKGDTNYNKSSANATFNVKEDTVPLKDTAITISASDITIGKKAVINLTLKTKDNVPINGTIDLKVDNANYTVKITDGKGSQTVANLPKGSHTVTANFKGDTNYNKSNASATFNVKDKLKTKIIYSNMDTAPVNTNTQGRIGDYFIVKLVDENNNILAGLPIKIGFNGKIYDRNTTTNGAAKLQINLPREDLYTFAICFLGDDDYEGSFEVAKITVDKKNPKPSEKGKDATGDPAGISKTTDRAATNIQYKDMVTVSVLNVDGRIGQYFTVKLVDNKGKALVGLPIKIGFNGKTYNRTTDDNGGAKLQINLPRATLYTFAIAYLGNEIYQGSFAVAKITVNKQSPKFTAPAKTFKRTAKTKTLTATLKTAKGNALKNKKISFTVNGKTYSATTNSKGVASVKVSLTKKGTYSTTAKFAGDDGIKATSKKFKVKIV